MRNCNYDNYNNLRNSQVEHTDLLIKFDTELHSPRSHNLFKQLSRRFKLNKLDWTMILALAVGSIYFLLREPLMTAILLSCSLFFYCLSQFIKYIPMLNRLTGARIRFWHVASIIIALTTVFSVIDLPAHALFLTGLQTAIQNLVTDANVSDAVIGNIFTAIRVIFLLLIVAAALFAYNQAQQGNDWRPIVTQAALALGIVIVIDTITFIFIGA